MLVKWNKKAFCQYVTKWGDIIMVDLKQLSRNIFPQGGQNEFLQRYRYHERFNSPDLQITCPMCQVAYRESETKSPGKCPCCNASVPPQG